MAKVLFWNIANFSVNKIGHPKMPLRSARNLSVIYQAIKKAPLDIFVLIELYARHNVHGGEGNLVKGNPAIGAIRLLYELNGIKAGWKLVPPVVTGQGGRREGVAVYYREDNLELTGPWVHTGIGGNAVQPPGGMVAPYPHPWSILTGGNTKGGMWKFKNVGGGAQEFPGPINRRPWVVHFKEYDAAKINHRTIEVVGFHAAPSKYAVASVQALYNTKEIVNTPIIPSTIGNSSVRVLGGDFNIDANNGPKVANTYTKIAVKKGFNWEFGIKPWGGYYKTSLRTRYRASIFDGPYPDYDYASRSYDHIFTKYEGIVPAKGGQNQMIINHFIGTDLKYAGLPVPGFKGGIGKAYGFYGVQPAVNVGATYDYPALGLLDIPEILGSVGVGKLFLTNAIANQAFVEDNFLRIRTTSDHMGVVMDV